MGPPSLILIIVLLPEAANDVTVSISMGRGEGIGMVTGSRRMTHCINHPKYIAPEV
jgi:hypothetical protein